MPAPNIIYPSGCPPLSFPISNTSGKRKYNRFSKENIVHTPAGLSNPKTQWVDLYSEGISGMLTEEDGGWYYKSNLGRGEFSHAQMVSPKALFLRNKHGGTGHPGPRRRRAKTPSQLPNSTQRILRTVNQWPLETFPVLSITYPPRILPIPMPASST